MDWTERSCPPDFLHVYAREDECGWWLRSEADGSVLVEFPLGREPVAVLGEYDPDVLEGHSIIPSHEFDLAGVDACISRYFFTGKGDPWTDGLVLDDVLDLEADLAPLGFGLARAIDLLVATATPENNRHLYGDTMVEGACEPDDIHPSSPIGGYFDCGSPTGIQDAGSSWVRLDDQVRGAGADFLVPGVEFAVLGGPDGRDTFYGMGTFGLHTHLAGDVRYEDDRVRLAAMPYGWAEGHPGYLAILADFLGAGGTFDAFYDNLPTSGLTASTRWESHQSPGPTLRLRVRSVR
ncbi:hypothetical protein L6R50_07640 [Myxococcota bacterium]|nr:hypothetical protein [Myxococcota bacterium]